MARARSIKPGFFRNEDLCGLQPWVRLLFAGLWTIADREGRLEDRPKRIKADVFPYDNFNVERGLAELAKANFIVRYEASGNKFIAIPTWKKHQNPHVKEVASTIPAPCEHSASTGNSGTSPADCGLPITDSCIPVFPVTAAAAAFPSAAAAIRSRFPTVDDEMIGRIFEAARAECPGVEDHEMVAVINKATKRGQESAALYLHTVPSVVKSWRD